MSVLVYKRNWDTGQYRLIHEFGPEARGAEQIAGDLHVLSATGERPLLVVSSGLWDTCLVDVGRGATRFEASPSPAGGEAIGDAGGARFLSQVAPSASRRPPYASQCEYRGVR